MKKQEDIQSFVINSEAQVKATGTTGTDTYQHVMQERRQIIGFELRIGDAFAGVLLEGAVVESIAELSSQALGLTEGVMGTLSKEVMAKALILAPADGVVALDDRVKEMVWWAPQGFAWIFEKGDGLYLHHWWNNGCGGNQTIHAYAIMYYVE